MEKNNNLSQERFSHVGTLLYPNCCVGQEREEKSRDLNTEEVNCLNCFKCEVQVFWVIGLGGLDTELIFLLPRTPAKQKERYPGFPEEFLFWPQIAGNRFRDSTEICFPQIKTNTAELCFRRFRNLFLAICGQRRVTLFLLSCPSKYKLKSLC